MRKTKIRFSHELEKRTSEDAAHIIIKNEDVEQGHTEIVSILIEIKTTHSKAEYHETRGKQTFG